MLPTGEHKMIEGKGKVVNRPTKTGKRMYDKFYIYVPTAVAKDGLFPFSAGEEVVVRIEPKNKELVIRSAPKSRKR